jgi:ABC-type phosphonate transport system ATPase subunit
LVLELDDAERGRLIDFYIPKNDGIRLGIDSLNLLRRVRIQADVEADGIASEVLEVSNTIDGWITLGRRDRNDPNTVSRQASLGAIFQGLRNSPTTNMTNNVVAQIGGLNTARPQALLNETVPADLRATLLEFIQRWHWFAPYRRPSQTSTPGEDYVVQPSGQNLSRVFSTLQTSRETEFADLRKDAQRIIPEIHISAPPIGNEVTIRVQEPGGVSVTLANTSEGVINALVIEGAAKTLPQNSLIMIEEPEVHLHAAAQRELFQIIKEAAKQRGHQVLITTHSTIFARSDDVTDTWLVTKRDGNSSVHKLLTEKDLLFLKRELGHENTDLFNANCIVITEGESEEIAFPIIAEDIGIDLEAKGIRIFNVRGSGMATRIELLLKYLKGSDTAVYLILDKHGSIEQHAEEWVRTRLIDQKRVKIWPAEFEDTFENHTIITAMKNYNVSEGTDVQIDENELKMARSNDVPVARFLQRQVFEKTQRELKKPVLAEQLAVAVQRSTSPVIIQNILKAIASGGPLTEVGL